MSYTIIAVTMGFLLDLLIGDPRWMYHPVRIIGNAITILERMIRRIFPKNKAGERIGGAILVILIIAGSTLIPFGILYVIYGWHKWAGVALETFFCYQLLATKSLKGESMKVYDQLEKENLEGARHAVSMIVGRDTQSLNEEGVTKATVETIAENASDGVIAPLFYMVIGGAVMGFAYKAINTMDSMVGYKNDRYHYFGTVAAKLDDVVNFIPARICAWVMIAASAFCKLNAARARKIYLRDRYNHASPNSAQTEAVMAGALEVQLAGDAFYFGKLYKKPTIGDPVRSIQAEDIPKANDLLYVTAFLAVIFFNLIRILVQALITLAI